ncbi:MAG TPA: hypothetical protein VKY89_02805 [Thermoanaerobaculia bacterium]|nr:hypothetical protein [Thermoanaerobaculia bacterium]
MIVDSLLLLLLLVAWGAHATVPWRLAATAPEPAISAPAISATQTATAKTAAPAAAETARGRRLWRLASLPLALAAPVAAYALASRNPDAAIAARLVPLLSSPPGGLLAVLVPALIGAAVIVSLAGSRLAGAGDRLVGTLGLAAGAVAAWAGELLRAGDGPTSPEPWFLLLAVCRLALMLAAGELLAPGRPRWAIAGGVAMLAYLPLLPPELRGALWHQGLELTCLAAALLLLAARWLPRVLRPLALAVGLLLAAVALSHAGQVSQALAPGIDVEELPVIR